MLCVRRGGIATLHRRFQATEEGLDRRGVETVLEALALGAEDPLLLGVNVGHGLMPRSAARNCGARRGAPYYSGLVPPRRTPRRRGAADPWAAGGGWVNFGLG